MQISEELKELIQENIDLIDGNNWVQVYENIYNYNEFYVGDFTSIMHECGIYPEYYLDILPKYFLSYNDIMKYSVPENITGIGANAFSICASLTEINLPKNLVFIGPHAFTKCKHLKSIDLPNSLTELKVGNNFSHCPRLETIAIPDAIKYIPAHCFSECTNLHTIKLPSNLIGIKASAFEKCTSLNNVTLPASLSEIKPAAFESCTSLTNMTYLGTVEQFQTIRSKDYGSNRWHRRTPLQIVHCKDGDVELNE